MAIFVLGARLRQLILGEWNQYCSGSPSYKFLIFQFPLVTVEKKWKQLWVQWKFHVVPAKKILKTSGIFIVMVGETTFVDNFQGWSSVGITCGCYTMELDPGCMFNRDVCPSSMACQLEIGRLGWMKEASQLVLAIICYILFVFENIKFLSISTMDLCLVLIFNQIREVFWWTCGLQILRPISWDANRQQAHFSSLYTRFVGDPLLPYC